MCWKFTLQIEIEALILFHFVKFMFSKKATKSYLCLVLLQVPKFFVLVQSFWASPKIWLHLVPLQKILCRHKKQFYWMQIIFLSGTKYLWLPQYVNKFLVWHKKFGPAQKILGPVKGHRIRLLKSFKFGRFSLVVFWWDQNTILGRLAF